MNTENNANDQRVSDLAQRVIDSLNAVITNSPTGVSFVSIKGYENSKGERANHLVNIGMDYGKQKMKDAEKLSNIDILDVEEIENKVLGATAKAELIAAFHNPNQAMSQAPIEAYTVLEHCPSIRVHNQTGSVKLQAYGVSKTVLVEGVYSEDNRREKTKIKDMLRKKYCSTANYKYFTIENIDTMGVNGDTISFDPMRVE
jgi:hypothetical protein